MRSLERGERRAELRQHDALLAEPLGHAEPAAEIDVAHVRESLRQRRERLADRFASCRR